MDDSYTVSINIWASHGSWRLRSKIEAWLESMSSLHLYRSRAGIKACGPSPCIIMIIFFSSPQAAPIRGLLSDKTSTSELCIQDVHPEWWPEFIWGFMTHQLEGGQITFFDIRSRSLQSLLLDSDLMPWNLSCHFDSELASMCAWMVALAFSCPLRLRGNAAFFSSESSSLPTFDKVWFAP